MKILKGSLFSLVAVLSLTAFSFLPAPTRPTLISPVSRTVVTDPNAVTLKWGKAVPSATHTLVSYEVEVSSSSAVNADGSFVAAGVVDSSTVAAPTTTYTIAGGALDYGTTYYWHVRANDSAPSSSLWSVMGIFRVGVEPPTLDPVSGTLTLQPTFSWTPGAQNADNYTFQYSTDSGFSTYTSATVIPTSNPVRYTPSIDMTPATSFYWRVRANNASLGASAWAVSAAPFTTANPPIAPVLISPKGTRESPTPTLTWKAASLRGNTTFLTYEIEIFDTNQDLDTATPVYSANVFDDASLGLQLTTSYKVPAAAGLLPTTTYYWRVKAFSNNTITGISGEYSTSAVSYFYTSIAGKVDATTMDPSETYGNVPGVLGPGVPTAKTIPGYSGTVYENANLLGLSPTLKWDPGVLLNNAQTFTIQIATQASGSCNPANPNNSTFAAPIVNVNINSTAIHKYTVNLEKYPNSVLCWRIRGNHTLYGSSEWSDVQVFKTANPPSIPVLVSPVSGTLTNDNSPRLVWQKVSLPSGTTFGKYEIEISYNSTFSGYTYPANTVPPFGDIDLTAPPYPLPLPILPGNPILDPVYPTMPPVPAFPNFPMIIQAHDPITELANGYECPYDSNYACHQIEEEIDTVFPIGYPLYGARTYYWRVRAYNADGEFSPWSAVRSIRITPDRATNLTVTDCAGNPVTNATSPRPCFDWDDVNGAGKYQIQIAKSDKFAATSVVLTGLSTTSYYQATKDLPKGTTLYWRVWAIGGSQYGSSLPEIGPSFASANPPSTPTLLLPNLNQLSLSTEPTFRWTRADVPASTTFDHYEIQIAQDKDFAFLVEPTAQTTPGDDYETNYTIGPGILTAARTYYWRVRACNNVLPINQCSNWSNSRYFRTAVGTPILVTPPDTSTMRPYFEWNAVNDATAYNIWITKNATCTAPLVEGNTTTNLYYRTLSNLVPGTYYWCVRANNPVYGPGAWSLIDSFTLP